MNDQNKLSGWALIIYGGLNSTSLLLAAYFALEPNSLLSVAYFVLEPNSLSTRSPPTALSVFYYVQFATHLLALLGGILLLKQNPFAHKIAFPASLFILINFPFGTIIGLIYLWRWYPNS